MSLDLRRLRGTTRTHLPAQIRVLGTQMPSRNVNGTRGREAPVEELKVINVARAPAQFRALPDDTGITLNGDKPVARVRPILEPRDSGARGRYGR